MNFLVIFMIHSLHKFKINILLLLRLCKLEFFAIFLNLLLQVSPHSIDSKLFDSSVFLIRELRHWWIALIALNVWYKQLGHILLKLLIHLLGQLLQILMFGFLDSG